VKSGNEWNGMEYKTKPNAEQREAWDGLEKQSNSHAGVAPQLNVELAGPTPN
jgi:hypothetical protein